MCQDKNEPEDKSFHLFWINSVTNKPGLSTTYDTLKDWFVCHSSAPERTKALVFVIVIVLAHEQAIIPSFFLEILNQNFFKSMTPHNAAYRVKFPQRIETCRWPYIDTRDLSGNALVLCC